jgi:IrrE N-terminal-like domain
VPFESASQEWTNASLQKLVGDRDPIAAMSEIVAELLLAAADAGAVGSPTNPFELAELMGIGLRPHFDVADARLVAGESHGTSTSATVEVKWGSAPLGKFVSSDRPLVIEYNPTRPRGRLRYSVAHELAHALFPDASEEVRRRTHTGAVEELGEDDSWQLELVCNVAAAELLMPTDAIEGLVNLDTNIDFLMAQRARFNVSTEALLRRLVHATDRPMALAAFSRIRDSQQSPLRCEYVLGSRAWTGPLARGVVVPANTVLAIPTAVGQTAHGMVALSEPKTDMATQAVGIPPYPRRRLPRVLALIEPADAAAPGADRIRFITRDLADALRGLDDPERTAVGRIIVAHVVSDSGHAWGRYGVAGTLGKLLPSAAAAFRAWSIASKDNLALGNAHIVDVQTDAGHMVTVASMLAQRGYGPSSTPRLSYTALAEALEKVSARAAATDAEVHIPRIGAGQAGGRWDLIQTTIERTMLDRGVSVVVYASVQR